jgi:hypothetical protein
VRLLLLVAALLAFPGPARAELLDGQRIEILAYQRRQRIVLAVGQKVVDIHVRASFAPQR